MTTRKTTKKRKTKVARSHTDLAWRVARLERLVAGLKSRVEDIEALLGESLSEDEFVMPSEWQDSFDIED